MSLSLPCTIWALFHVTSSLMVAALLPGSGCRAVLSGAVLAPAFRLRVWLSQAGTGRCRPLPSELKPLLRGQGILRVSLEATQPLR